MPIRLDTEQETPDKTLYGDFAAWARKHDWFCTYSSENYADWVSPNGSLITIPISDGVIEQGYHR